MEPKAGSTELTRAQRAWAGMGVGTFFLGLWGPLCFLQFLLAVLIFGTGLAVLLGVGGGLEPETFPRVYAGSWVVLLALVAVTGLRYRRSSPDHPFHWRFILAAGAVGAATAMGLIGLLVVEQGLSRLVLMATYGFTDFCVLVVVVFIGDATIRLARWTWHRGTGSSFGAGVVTGAGPLLAFIGLPLFVMGLGAASAMFSPPEVEGDYVESLRVGYSQIANAVREGVRSWPSVSTALAEISAPTPEAPVAERVVATLGQRSKQKVRWPPRPEGLDCLRASKPNYASCALMLEQSVLLERSPREKAERILATSIPQAEAEDRSRDARDRVCERRCDLASDRERLVPYYIVAAMNSGVDYFREQREDEFDEERDSNVGDACRYGPEETLRSELRQTVTRRALDELGRDRRAAELCIFHSVTEAAREFGRPISTMSDECKRLKKTFECEVRRLTPYYYY